MNPNTESEGFTFSVGGFRGIFNVEVAMLAEWTASRNLGGLGSREITIYLMVLAQRHAKSLPVEAWELLLRCWGGNPYVGSVWH